MKEITEKDVIDALHRGIAVYMEAAEKEGRENTPWEKEQIEYSKMFGKKIKRNSHYFKHIVELVEKEYIEESIILTVTLFEFLMRDLVKDHKNLWFYFPLLRFSELPSDKKLIIRKKIKKFLEEGKMFEQYLINIHLYRDAPEMEIEALYHTFFDDERDIDRIKFQNLSDKKGVKEIIKFLYDIKIIDYLDQDKIKARDKWTLLGKLIQDRHNIVHRGDPATLKREEIIEIINSVGELNHNILQKLIHFQWQESKKQHALLMEKYKIKIN